MMYVFRNCKAFIRTIPLLRYDSVRPEDLDTADEDHVADEVRYFCMSRPIAPRAAQNPACGDPSLRLFLDIDSSALVPPPRRETVEIIE